MQVFGIVCASYKIYELLNYFSKDSPSIRIAVANTIEYISNSPQFLILNLSSERWKSALELYARRKDKGYSGIDCISMCAMKKRTITQIVTSENHFAQEGFEVIKF